MTMMQANRTRLPAVVETKSERPIYTVEDVGKMAQQVAASQMFGLNQAQAFVLMMLCQSEGIDPIQAVRRYHIIQGRPAMRADAMLAEMLDRGWQVTWQSKSNDHDTAFATFQHTSKCPKAQDVGYSIDEAKRAGLIKDGSGWVKHPAAMLRARVISTAVRMLDPGIIVGIYTPEEAEEDVQTEVRQTRAEVLEQRLEAMAKAPSKTVEVRELVQDGEGKVTAVVSPDPATNVPPPTPIPNDPPKPPEAIGSPAWSEFIDHAVIAANSLVEADCQAEGVKPFKAVTREQVGNHLCNEEIESGRLKEETICAGGKIGGKRMNARVRGVMEEIWKEDSAGFQRRVNEYIGSMIDEACRRVVTLGMAQDTPPE